MDMRSSRKIAIIVVIAVGLFGYSQHASASQISAHITQSNLIEENDRESTYDVELRFDNPSLLVLTAGETDFFVIADEKTIGKGKLQSFTLQPIKSSIAYGTIVTDSGADSEDAIVKITGTTKYDIGFTSIDVPFVYYPTEQQAREFIHQD